MQPREAAAGSGRARLPLIPILFPSICLAKGNGADALGGNGLLCWRTEAQVWCYFLLTGAQACAGSSQGASSLLGTWMCGCSLTECSVGGEEAPPALSSTADAWMHGSLLMPRVVAGCDNVAACGVDSCPQSHSATQNTRGGCFHEGGAMAAVAFCSSVRAQLEKHGIILEQGLCVFKSTDTPRHVKQVLKVIMFGLWRRAPCRTAWVEAPCSCPTPSPPEPPAQPPHVRAVLAALCSAPTAEIPGGRRCPALRPLRGVNLITLAWAVPDTGRTVTTGHTSLAAWWHPGEHGASGLCPKGI